MGLLLLEPAVGYPLICADVSFIIQTDLSARQPLPPATETCPTLEFHKENSHY